MIDMAVFSSYLERKYLDWQSGEGTRRTIKDFAEYLGVGRVNLTRWMNGDTEPDGENVDRLASKLGMEVYDQLGLARPIHDDRLNLLNRVWDLLPESLKDEFADRANHVKERGGDGHKVKTKK